MSQLSAALGGLSGVPELEVEALRAVNLLQERNLLPPRPLEAPEPNLSPELKKVNCSPQSVLFFPAQLKIFNYSSHGLKSDVSDHQDVQVHPDQHPPDSGSTQQGQTSPGPPPPPIQRFAGGLFYFIRHSTSTISNFGPRIFNSYRSFLDISLDTWCINRFRGFQTCSGCLEKVTPEVKLRKCVKFSSQTLLLVTSFASIFASSPPAAATSDHLKHNSPLSLLPHIHQPLCHLPGPTQVEVQPLLPNQ